MLNYNELRLALQEAKETANREIAAVIVQTEKSLTAREIANLLSNGDTSRGISSQSVANLIAHGEVRYYAANLGYEIDKKEVEETKLYINSEDPADTISITRRHNVYIPRKRR